MPESKIVKVPPDGGWGYMICVGFTIMMVVCTSPINCFGLFYSDFLKENGDNGQIVTWKVGVCGVVIALSATIISVGSKYTSLRMLSLVASILYISVWTSNIFITQPWHLLITHGIIEGFGWGMIRQGNYVVFNSYFVEKRVMLMGVCMAIVTVGGIAAPYIVEYWMATYGFRGALILMTGVSLHTLIGTALFQPAEWHLVPKIIEEVTGDEDSNKKEIDISYSTNKEISAISSSVNENIVRRISIHNENYKKENDTNFNSVDSSKTQEDKTAVWMTVLKKVKLFKSFMFCNICLGIATGMLGDIYFSIMLPMLLYDYDLGRDKVAFIVSVLSITDLISKIVLGVVGKFFKIRSFYWFYVAMIITFIARIVFLQISSFVAICITIAIIGFMRAWIYVFFPLLIAEEMPNENYADAFGFAMLTDVFFSIFYSLLTSLSNSFTGSYVISFYILTFSALITIVLWTVQIVKLNRKNK